MSAQSKNRRVRRSQHSEFAQLLQQLINECENPAHFFEIYYWSGEPELVEIMRQVVALPDEARGALHAFLRLAGANVKSVTVTADTNGDVTLSSPVVTELFESVMTSAAEDGPTGLLH